MKLALIFSLLAPMTSFAAPTTAPVCGTVLAGEQCDVDFCFIRFIAQDSAGKPTVGYGLMDGGMIFAHDYQTHDLEKFAGKNVCVDASKIDQGYGLIDIKNLVIR